MTLCANFAKYIPQNACVLDAGCGDCYYTGKIEKALADKNASIAGIDISKFALIAAAKRSKNIRLAVASVFALPTADFPAMRCLMYFHLLRRKSTTEF